MFQNESLYIEFMKQKDQEDKIKFGKEAMLRMLQKEKS